MNWKGLTPFKTNSYIKMNNSQWLLKCLAEKHIEHIEYVDIVLAAEILGTKPEVLGVLFVNNQTRGLHPKVATVVAKRWNNTKNHKAEDRLKLLEYIFFDKKELLKLKKEKNEKK